MINPDPLVEAQKRLAQLEQEYQEAQARSATLANELLKAQKELWRPLRGSADPSADTLELCNHCSKTLAFTENDWFLTCSCAYRTLHPQRHGELKSKNWSLVFCQSGEGAGSWGWSLLYRASCDETPPEGSVRVKLWSEKQGWLFLYGASRRDDEQDGPAQDRTLTWRGPLAEDSPAREHSATRVFVEPWYGAY